MSRKGEKWAEEEESLLLNELRNLSIEEIAKKHERTIWSIELRRRDIAYRMHIGDIFTTQDIVKITKLTESEILETIVKTQEKEKKKREKEKAVPKDLKSVNENLNELKNEISELKSQIKELTEMLNAVYEFENA
jgi:septal ring factor EnvC (AmiA/AmiB activator)